MAYPDDLDNLFDPSSTTPLNNTPKAHSDWHTDANTAIEALEAKVGADSSAVATSLDYLLKSASSASPGHTHSKSESGLGNVDNTSDATKNSAIATLENKTLTSPTINGATITGTIAFGDNAPNIAPKARAKRSGNQTIGNDSWTKVQFDTESFDIGGDYDNATNYRFTAPVTGYYLVNTLITWGNISGEDHYTKIYKNGTGIITNAIHGVTGNAYSQVISDIVPLTAAQYVEIYVYQNSGGDETISSESYIVAHLIST